jgi:glycosyltransferase involved in cell wall biosynthesis
MRAAPVTLVGHPYATVGMGEQLRSHIAACKSVHLEHGVVDIFRHSARADPDHRRLVDAIETDEPPGGIRIFHINGDEVKPVLEAFAARKGKFADGYNIIVPAWELPQYPAVWAEQLKKFDEVWALSHFLSNSLADAGIASTYVGQAVEVPTGYFLPRRYFGLRESAFVILHFLDLSSYATRKNPEAVLRLFEALRKRHEFADIQLVLKAKRGDGDAADWLDPFRERLPGAVFLSQPMSSLETRSLVNCCDCFASLHRAEGFGRGTGEAMYLGRLALATGWSGNLDYMTADNSLLVDYRLVPVGAEQYPHGEGQSWAEPNLAHAFELLNRVISDRPSAAELARRGRRDIRLGYSFRAVGLRILDRIGEIEAGFNLAREPRETANDADAVGTPPPQGPSAATTDG